MIKVNVSTPWNHTDYSSRLPADKLAPYQFYFDQTEGEFDFWIIWGGIKDEKQSVVCPKEHIIYLTDEVHEQRFFNKFFLEQFAAVFTCRTDLGNGNNIIPCHELNTWMVQRNYDTLAHSHLIPKTKTLSVVCSDQTWLPGHKLRYAFVNKLIGHFKDKLDVFGKGFNPVADKFDALAPYKYSIAIENSNLPGYFTEKIADCYLTHTMPVYYGCPDINQYFDPSSYCLIDPGNFKDSVNKIESIVESNLYESALPSIINSKIKYLEQYHIFSKLVHLLNTHFFASINKQKNSVLNERCFERGYSINKFINRTWRILHIPGRFYFSVTMDQSKTLCNKK